MEGTVAAGVSAVLLGLPGFEVVSAVELAGQVRLRVQTTDTRTGCLGCGVIAALHGRRTVRVRDLPAGGRPVVLEWAKRIWRCEEPACPARTWSETNPQIAARAVLTERARAWAMRRVGKEKETVALPVHGGPPTWSAGTR